MNRPAYSEFISSDKLSKPERGTLEWLVREEFVSEDDDPQHQHSGATEEALCKEDFIAWRDSSRSDYLLVTGSPGQGKSVLSNFVLGHLKGEILQKNTLLPSKVIYYFCNIKNDELSRTANSIIRALIVQLCECQPTLFRHIPEEFKNDNRSFFLEDFDTLCNLFQRMLQDAQYERVYCVIDGLDVYKVRMDDLIFQLTSVFKPNDQKGPVLKLFCTSRPDKAVLNKWGQLPRKILCCNTEDLDIFIQSRVSSLGIEFTKQMRDVLEGSLRKNTGRTFLWLQVVIRRIRMIEYPTLSNIEQTIEKSPEDLWDLYQLLLTTAVQGRENALVLAWVVHAQCPLNLKALGDAIAIGNPSSYKSHEQLSRNVSNLTERLVHKNLGALLDVFENHVFLIHQSVKDFFLQKDPLQDSLSGPIPRIFLAKSCMTYLTFEEFGRLENLEINVSLPYLPTEYVVP